MDAANKIQIPKLKFYEPRRNLPGKAGHLINAESIFTVKVTQTYLERFKLLHHRSNKTSLVCAREIPINGFGISDLVTVAWDESRLKDSTILYNSEWFINFAKPTIRAFEFKLSNWRRALMQASRYRFFANVSIVVLPIEKCLSPLKYLNTFKKIRVGLWGFDSESNRIITYYTPKPSRPFIRQYHITAVQLVQAATKALPIV